LKNRWVRIRPSKSTINKETDDDDDDDDDDDEDDDDDDNDDEFDPRFDSSTQCFVAQKYRKQHLISRS